VNRQAQRPTLKEDAEPERAYGRRTTTISRTSRDELLAQFRQARRRLGAMTRR